MPVSRNGSISGLKLQNGCAPAKSPAGSPSPRLAPTPTHMPTILDEPGEKVKKSAPPQSRTTSPTASQGFPGTGESRSQRPGSWASRDSIFSTSPKLAKAITNGHRLKGEGNGVDLEKGDSSSSSPEHSASSDAAKAPQTSEGRAAHVCDSQGTNCPATGHSKVLSNGVDAKMGKLKSPALSSTTTEPTSLMSPPPAKKLALSAKKASTLRRATGNDIGSPSPSAFCDLTSPMKATHPVVASPGPVSKTRAAAAPAPQACSIPFTLCLHRSSQNK